MGCDIHLYAEAKIKKGFFSKLIFWKKPKWESIEKWVLDDSCNPPQMVIPYDESVYTGGRNYNLFSALCGVRSYVFVSPPKPISKPRGIPKDTCSLIKKKVDLWNADGHSHNYNTLKELKEYDWSKYGKTCQDFLDEVIPKMEAVGVKDTDVRIVYFFDN